MCVNNAPYNRTYNVIYGGNSGSALVGSDGFVYGIAVQGDNKTNWAISAPVEYLNKTLEEVYRGKVKLRQFDH